MNEYYFDVKNVYDMISKNWKSFFERTNSQKCVIGISGGVDSTCTTALACKIFGNENVIGISLPCDVQYDIEDVIDVYNHFKIQMFTLNIGDAFHSIIDGVENCALNVSDVTRINLPARLRMTSLYAFAQSIPNAMVINTCNLSEDLMGYNTFGGDNIGSYAPIRFLTKTEVRKLAEWLDVPDRLVNKIPVDGLQSKTDEERFGFTYAELDDYIRTGNPEFKHIDRVKDAYLKNKFKLDIVDLPGPKFDFPNFVI